MKKYTCLILLTVLVTLLLTACSCEHEWTKATCTEPEICLKCGETTGEALGHKWKEANCTTPKTCSACKVIEGNALGHSWNNATCTTPKTCSACNTTEGYALGHNWNNATCTTPMTCSVCNAREGEAWGHEWESATCTTPKKCSFCGLTDGDTKAHSYQNGKCTICGKSDPNYTPPKTYYCKICDDVVVSSKGDVCKECRCPACGAYNYPSYDGYGVRRPYCQSCNCRYYGCYAPVMRPGGFWCELHACHKEGCSKQAEKDSFYCRYHQ